MNDRKSTVKVGLIVIACGAVVTFFASGVSKNPMVLTFGAGPILLGLVVVLMGLFGPKKAANKPFPQWKTLLVLLSTGTFVLPRSLFDYRFPHWARPYVLAATAIVCAIALWPVRVSERAEDHA